MATEEKFRLNNPNKFSVGIITMEKQNGINILPGSFTMVTRDEVDYLMSTCTLFQDGVLRLPDNYQQEVADTLGVNMEDNANFMSDEDIKKKLSGNMNQLRRWLESGDIQPYVMERIAEIAKGMNLKMDKIQLLQEKMPNHDFLEK